MTQTQKTISLCVIGKPNAGKSSLLNKILGEKLSIVTPKVQTTRTIITGIVTLDDCQIIIIDTPGIFTPAKTLERAMVKKAWAGLNGVDSVIFIADSTKKFDDITLNIFSTLKERKIKPILLLNKIDLKNSIGDLLEEEAKTIFENPVIFKISALLGEGIDSIIKEITSRAKNSPWLYDKDDMTTLPMRFLASEITREKLFLELEEELPYNLTVETESWEEKKDKSVKINQAIIVSKKSHKPMIIGKHGSKIKQIGLAARIEIEKFFGMRVHLFLFVKVRPDWEENPAFYEI